MSLVRQPTGGAVLYVQSHVQDRARGAFDRWCDSVHHFDTMRIEGFLALRRFERIGHAGSDSSFDLLTLYQLADAGAADFESPAYRAHTASYVPPPPIVDGAVTFERTIYGRSTIIAAVQPIGTGLVTIATGDAGLLDGIAAGLGLTEALIGAARFTRIEGPGADALLIVDTATTSDASQLLDAVTSSLASARDWHAAAFRQVFPERGALLRDRAYSR